MSDYYFRKWKQVLVELEKHVKLDLDYQLMKVHDQKCCEAAHRLGSVLAKYMSLYNNSMDCLQQSMQVQKTEYMQNVVNAITSRILELRQQLRKLESHYYQFFGNGLIQHMLTFSDVDLMDIPCKMVRSQHVQAVIDEIMLQARKEKELCSVEVIEEEKMSTDKNEFLSLWDSDVESDEVEKEKSEIIIKLSNESIKRMEMIKLIQAHERSRQVIRWDTRRKLKREKWEKELSGTTKPQARFEVKERAAALIQKVCRAYFEIKRRRVIQCKIDEILDCSVCVRPNPVEKLKDELIKNQRLDKRKQYKEDSLSNIEAMKITYLKKIEYNTADDYRDFIREWFKKWYEEVKFFYDIPKEELGGSSLIINEIVPTPSEWLAEYKVYLEQKKSNKNKTSVQKKWEKLEAKKEEIRLKKEEQRKLKLEQELIKKMMKNPNLHPGFHFPMSKKTESILKAIENYRNDWNDFDTWETEGFKEGFVREIDHNNACMSTKLEILRIVDEDMRGFHKSYVRKTVRNIRSRISEHIRSMRKLDTNTSAVADYVLNSGTLHFIRQELQVLKCALQSEYKRSNEKMPEKMKVKQKKTKRKQKVDSTLSESVQEKMQELTAAGYLKEKTQMKFEDFLGDFNFVGDDLRCALQPAAPLGGEMRLMWWEKCNELVHSARRFVLVGPHGSGKTTLVNILTAANDAILFELDPANVSPDVISPAHLRQVVSTVVTCARAAQPSVIHLKSLHLLYCKKVPQDENKQHLNLFSQFFVRMLLKKIHKNDLITVIGSCRDPWLTKTSKLLKNFPDMIMMPYTTYSTVSMILRKWMTDNRVVPRNLNIQSIAQLLLGYSFGHIKDSLDSFLIPEIVIKIAAYGLSPREVLDHVTRGVDEVDYKKYKQWYTDNTTWGRREAKRLQDDKEFKLMQEKFAEKQKKKLGENVEEKPQVG